MQRTESQQNASRENGAKSNGPVTPEGKQRSSQNATRLGLFSDSILLKPENRAAWNALSDALATRFRPDDPVELGVVHDMATTQWRKERALNIEAALIDMEYHIIDLSEADPQSPADQARRIAWAYSNAHGRGPALERVGREIIRLGNYWMRLHKKLKELQKDRRDAEAEAAKVAEKAAEQAEKPATAKSENEPGKPEPVRNQPVATVRPDREPVRRPDPAPAGPVSDTGNGGGPPCSGS